jgi:hypothetical protein
MRVQRVERYYSQQEYGHWVGMMQVRSIGCGVFYHKTYIVVQQNLDLVVLVISGQLLVISYQDLCGTQTTDHEIHKRDTKIMILISRLHSFGMTSPT